ncbi:hypothetical protein EFU41_18215 [Vibrio cholerae]|uniref:hypothetical protein n=1 Tax=Vibrio cholerae TaxID=666 RepID=UPI0026541410|nr:hypothetical protein [Vibrio cholerae]EGR1126232.1 hypothetical protein [Vibrio cholerae]EKG0043036.1 hypothetical protein [Vibrio cholerae]ELR6565825.1 hypothetical protein [Vibrio cholerae]MDN6983100.1 hypothetical protein [Vibrio cholerae]MDN6983102.1 hypothetical protein [Vibrio cholerae]
MTESAHNKTKRKLINNIKDIKPTHQTAIFYNNFDEAIEFNDLMQKIKKPVSAAFKSITMIWVLRLKHQFKYGVVGYIQILTSAELDLKLLNKVLAKYTRENQVRTVQRPFDREKYTDTVSKQKLANLAAYLSSETSPRRYAITNKPQINKNAQN